jgi:hypothetical protein
MVSPGCKPHAGTRGRRTGPAAAPAGARARSAAARRRRPRACPALLPLLSAAGDRPGAATHGTPPCRQRARRRARARRSGRAAAGPRDGVAPVLGAGLLRRRLRLPRDRQPLRLPHQPARVRRGGGTRGAASMRQPASANQQLLGAATRAAAMLSCSAACQPRARCRCARNSSPSAACGRTWSTPPRSPTGGSATTPSTPSSLGGWGRVGCGVGRVLPWAIGEPDGDESRQQAVAAHAGFQQRRPSPLTHRPRLPAAAPPRPRASPPSQPLRRVGSAADGGKIICDVSRLAPPCVIYSLGSMGDYSFEKEVRGCPGGVGWGW